jgi:hypothetical protein
MTTYDRISCPKRGCDYFLGGVARSPSPEGRYLYICKSCRARVLVIFEGGRMLKAVDLEDAEVAY